MSPQNYEADSKLILSKLKSGPHKSNELFRSVPEYKTCINILRGKGHRIKAEKTGPVTLYTWLSFAPIDDEHGRIMAEFNAEFSGRCRAVALTPDDDDQWAFYVLIPNLSPLIFQAPSLPAAVDLARRFLTDPNSLPLPVSFHVEHRPNTSNHDDKQGD